LATVGKLSGFDGLATDAILLQFGVQRGLAIERFQEFVLQGMGKDIWSDLKHQIYLGSSDFVVRKMEHLKAYEGELSEVPLKQRRNPAKTLDEYKAIN